MMNANSIFSFKINPEYKKKVAYFSMEFAIHQPLKIYSGGLGFLAGSHMRSAYELKQNLVGVGMLWKYGYYDQSRNTDGSLGVVWRQKMYNFLENTGIKVFVKIFGREIFVKAYLLNPETFKSAPIILLSTDVEENDHWARSLTDKLYDNDKTIRLAQQMVLGIGGAKVLEQLGFDAEIFHMNEAHPLPLAFHLLTKYHTLDEVKKRMVFTTHTPEDAGNERSDIATIEQIGFLNGLPVEPIKHILLDDKGVFNHTLVALRMAKIANAVSKIHGKVSNEMWKNHDDICPIIAITNAQNKKYWADEILDKAAKANDVEALVARKKEMKKAFLEYVADQTGKILDPEALTIVWARRFAGYKRANLLMRDMEKFIALANNSEKPIQVIWAGKPYPLDYEAIRVFNEIYYNTRDIKNCTILHAYELKLSKLMKQGSDIWLNNPRYSREASGTSGMTAAMNGSVNFSIRDGWVDEFAEHGVNSFVIPHADVNLDITTQDNLDSYYMYQVLEKEIIPTYYDNPKKWNKIVMTAMKQVVPEFESGRMADEYYKKVYNI
ncbi:MAG: alpha-glucan family phosphorylase [Saprospiraceae bacterium]|nr:alpha-glucan family phosphorylase [Saprospiraceae bacterium]